jgi:hypothetical protein
MSYDFTAAAWVPEIEHRDWDDAFELGASGLRGQVGDLRHATLVKVAHNSGVGVVGVQRFPGTVTTPRSTGARPGPVLVYVPNEQTLQTACRLARRSSICVVESSLLPVRGWAMATGAINLDQPDKPSATLPSPVATLLERLASYGNNGWFPQFDRDRAVQILEELADMYALDIDGVVGYMLAQGKSPDGVKQLRRLAKRVQR